MTVTSVNGRAKTKATAATDYPGWCARPACRKEFRRTVGVGGRPNHYCSPECQQAMRTERKAAAAKVRRIEEMLRQARTDLDAFDAHDLDKALESTDYQRADVALGKAATALKYLAADSPGLPELAELANAVTALIAKARPDEEVA